MNATVKMTATNQSCGKQFDGLMRNRLKLKHHTPELPEKVRQCCSSAIPYNLGVYTSSHFTAKPKA